LSASMPAQTRLRTSNRERSRLWLPQEPGVIGQYGVDAAVTALEGGQVTPKVQTGFTIITKDNVDGEAADAVYKSTC
jgi:ribose transport system substrate-binding protein